MRRQINIGLLTVHVGAEKKFGLARDIGMLAALANDLDQRVSRNEAHHCSIEGGNRLQQAQHM
jgi:hypothetical protein